VSPSSSTEKDVLLAAVPLATEPPLEAAEAVGRGCKVAIAIARGRAERCERRSVRDSGARAQRIVRDYWPALPWTKQQ
jgi:hypothetical protein